MRLGLLLLSLPIIASCNKKAPPETLTDAAAPTTSTTTSAAPDAAAAGQNDAVNAVMAAPTFLDAIKAADSLFDDSPPPVNEPGGGVGTVAVTTWAARHLVGSDVFLLQNETTYPIALRDAKRERGRRLCLSGKIMYIKPRGEGIDQFAHGMLSAKEGMVEFLAVGMRGKLADGSDARFCGAVMGEARYATKQGPARTITLVGMFDLPENRTDGGH